MDLGFLFTCAWLVLLTYPTVSAKWVEGNLDTDSDWQFLGRFCFLSERGSLEYNFIYPVAYSTEDILLYYDTDSQWPSVYPSSKSCSHKFSVLSIQNNQVISLNTSYTRTSQFSGCKIIVIDGESMYNCTNSRRFRAMRERWWFVAVSRCHTSPNQSCAEKFDVLHIRNHQVISLNDSNQYISSVYSGCHKFNKTVHDGSEMYWNCTGSRTFRSLRERWWFIAASRCYPSTPKGMKLQYSMHMTNGGPDEILYHEFSADEFYILPTDITFLLIHLIIFVLTVICAAALRDRQLFHTTYKMFFCTVCLWMFHIFLLCVVYGKYSNTGQSERRTKVSARVFSSAAELIFLLMLILMGSGYTITRGKLKALETIIFTVFTCLFSIVYIVLLIWEAVLFDPGQVLYIYQSPAGYGIISLHLIGWLWFVISVFLTMKKYPSKGKFYIPFTIFYTIWFFATPIMILISNLALPQWLREKTVNGVELFIGLAGHVFFLVLTRPAAANTNFPYHVRTTQIGTLDGTEGDVGSPMTTTSYSAGTGPDFTGLFVVSHTHSTNRRTPPTNNGFANDSPPPKYKETTISNGVLPPITGALPTPATEQTTIPTNRLPPIASAPPVPDDLPTGAVYPPSYETLFQASGNSKSS